MERKEPTFGETPNMAEIEFRPNKHRGFTPRTPPDDFTKLIVLACAGVVVLVAIIMGLIEWNARRQAAAMTNELMRPMTAKEAERFKEWERQTEAEADRALQQLWQQTTQQQNAQAARQRAEAARQREARALRAGERCIQGRRFKRIENGWEQIPHQPC